MADGIRQLDELYEQNRDLEFDDLFEIVDIWMKTLYTNGRISYHEWMRFELSSMHCAWAFLRAENGSR